MESENKPNVLETQRRIVCFSTFSVLYVFKRTGVLPVRGLYTEIDRHWLDNQNSELVNWAGVLWAFTSSLRSHLFEARGNIYGDGTQPVVTLVRQDPDNNLAVVASDLEILSHQQQGQLRLFVENACPPEYSFAFVLGAWDRRNDGLAVAAFDVG